MTTVRARAPLRLGLAGGGTDLSPYCDLHGGAVLNITIDRYAYAFVGPSPDRRLHFRAADLGMEEWVEASPAGLATARLAIHAGVYRRMLGLAGVEWPALSVSTSVDAPAGSGLGSSSALVVALVEAFRNYLGLPLGLYDVAHQAFEVERRDLGLAGGKQDQYAAAFGGANFIEFLADDRVIVNPLRVPRGVINELQTSLVTCFTGVSRSSAAIIEQQQRGMLGPSAPAIEGLHQLKSDALEMKQALLRGELSRMGEILNRSWAAKKRTADGVSSEAIDALHAVAMRNGAQAGKVSGAGGGGFVMFLVTPERRVGLIRALTAAGLDASHVHLTQEGVESWTSQHVTTS